MIAIHMFQILELHDFLHALDSQEASPRNRFFPLFWRLELGEECVRDMH